MELVILIGIQGSGKSTFCRHHFFDSHIRINLDMLKTKNREQLLVAACLEAKQPFVVDKTNVTLDEREKYIKCAKDHGFKVRGYYFKSKPSDCLARNASRPEKARVPEKGVLGTYKRLQLPSLQEGFDELYYVEIDSDHNFQVKEWQNEI